MLVNGPVFFDLEGGTRQVKVEGESTGGVSSGGGDFGLGRSWLWLGRRRLRLRGDRTRWRWRGLWGLRDRSRAWRQGRSSTPDYWRRRLSGTTRAPLHRLWPARRRRRTSGRERPWRSFRRLRRP